MRVSSLVLAIMALTASATAFLSSAAVAQEAEIQPQTQFSIDDAIDLSQVSAPQLSPDGTRVLYTHRTLDWDENKRNGRIWMVGSDGLAARPYTSSKDDNGASWSPDGLWITFTRPVGDDKTRQIFILSTSGGEAIQLTQHMTSVGRVTWARDAKAIFFSASDSLEADRKKERKKGDDVLFVDEGPSGQTQGSWNGVWRVEVSLDEAPHTAERMTPVDRRVGGFAPSPDGALLAYTYRTENQRNGNFNSEIVLRDLEAETEVTITNNEAPESSLVWSPNGKVLNFVAPDLETWQLDQGNLYAYEVATRTITQYMPDFQGSLRTYRWTPDSRRIFFDAQLRSDAHLFVLEVGSGEVVQLSDGAGLHRSASYSKDFSAVVYHFGDPTSPGDLWFGSVGSSGIGSPKRLTEANPWIGERELTTPELVTWKSKDGLEIEGVLYTPKDRQGAGAMVLKIHGGPAGVFSRGFDVDAQLLVNQGYALLQPNVRGSSGYGDDLLRGNMNDIGGGDYDDLMTGVEAMIARGVAHPDSLAVKGWSYGGILGGWTITQTDRFKAASLGAMVADWRSEFGSGFNFDVARWYIGGDPWSNRDEWLRRSSYTHLDQVKTPTILFHGANDRTDTMEQSMNYFAGLRHLGVEARFLLFPREGHGISEPRHRRTLLVEEMRWFQKYVRDIDWEAPERPGTKDEKNETKVISPF